MTTADLENRPAGIAAAHAAHGDWDLKQGHAIGNLPWLSASYAAQAEVASGRAAALRVLHSEHILAPGGTHAGPVAPFDRRRDRDDRPRAPRPALSRAQLRQVRAQKIKRARQLGLASPRRRFQLLTQWDGWVSHIGDDTFEAEVVALGRTAGFRRLDIEIPRKLVRAEDSHLLREGAAFYYCIGRAWIGSDVIPDTVLWFRRYVARDPEEAELRARAQSLVDGVGWTD